MNTEYYESIFNEDARAFGTRAEQIEFIYTKKLLDQYIKPTSSVIELGCGTGYYGLYLADKCKSYHGVDLVPKHVEQFKAKINNKNLTNLSSSLGNATSLPEIEDSTYDSVMVMGPMYHLPREDRQKVIKESQRICKAGGMILFAYINKIGAYLRACLDENMKLKYPNKKANENVLTKGIDDDFPDTFFYTMPEEIEKDAVENGLCIVQNAGVNFAFNASDVNKMPDEKYQAWRSLVSTMRIRPKKRRL